MLAGPFGIAAGAKAQAPTIPLWALVVSAQLIDILFVILHLAGIEGPAGRALVAPGNAALVQAPYSHALVTSLVLAALAGLLARGVWGRGAGVALAGVVVANWIVAFLLFRDLPVLPGNAGGLPLLGLGLAATATARTIVEVVLVLAGAFLYYRAALRLPAPSIRSSQAYRTRAVTSAAVTAVLLLLALGASLAGLD